MVSAPADQAARLAVAKAMAEKVDTVIFFVWMALLMLAFLPLILLSSLITDSGSRYFFCGMLAGAAVYIAFWA